MMVQRYQLSAIVVYSVLLLIIPISDGVKRKVPKWVEKCSRSASKDKIRECAITNLNIFKPRLAKGIPHFRIPPLDPLQLDKVVLDVGQFHAEFRNISIQGASDFKLIDCDFDFENYRMSLDVLFASVYMESFYEMKGHILFDLDSHGRTSANYTNLLVTVNMHGKAVPSNGNTYLDFSDRKLNKISLDDMVNPILYFSDLFPNNENLTANTNRIINENIGELYKEFLPVMEDVIGSFVMDSLQHIFKMLPIEELFLP